MIEELEMYFEAYGIEGICEIKGKDENEIRELYYKILKGYPKEQEEKISYISIDNIANEDFENEDFENEGRIIKRIRYYLANYYENYKDNQNDLTIINEALNSLFIKIIGIVDFRVYNNRVIKKCSFNGIIIKGLFLKTINDFWNEVKKDNGTIINFINKYTIIISDMMKFLFSKEDTFSKEEIIKALGSYGEENKISILNLIKNHHFSIKGNILVNKLKYIDAIVKESMNLNDMSKILVNGKINGIMLLYFFSSNALSNTQSYIDYDGIKHRFTGIELNTYRIWLFPDFLLDYDGFANGIIEIGNYVEQNININFSIDYLGKDIHKLFNYENITAISLINLFESEYLSFKVISEDCYLVEISKLIADNFLEYKKYLRELIRTLRGYNDLNIDNFKLIFEVCD